MIDRNTAGVGVSSGSVLEPRCCTNDVRGGAQCLRDGSGRLLRPRKCVDSLEEQYFVARAAGEVSHEKVVEIILEMSTSAGSDACLLSSSSGEN